ncbi:alpha-glucosidase [Evansella vedderi]|uniref:Alpha-glucosidase n=1 Tax=Evansella vedderi TaxID=38282 RepID=A0ABT9ZZG9_9BACI|nr:alpha-glucosidase [Evansella vedderi]MDQ0256639.1 alpha-glucosidase [Evansella vedderi]
MRNRVIIGLVLSAIMVIGGGVIYYAYKVDPPVFSTIEAADDILDTLEFPLGPFQLTWLGSEARFEITHDDIPDHLIFSTPKNRGFLAAGYGVMESEESRGYFTIDEERRFVCEEQWVSGIVESPGAVTIVGDLGCENGESVPFEFTLTVKSDFQLQYAVSFDHPLVNRTFLSWHSDGDEHFFGFGEQYSTFDMKGRRLPILVQEQGVGRGLQPLTFLADLTNRAGGTWYHTYAPVPQFVSSKLRSLFSENKEYQVFHFTEKDVAQLEVYSAEAIGRIYAGASPADLVREHTSVVGRMEPLPAWTQEGLILGAQGGTAVVSEKLDSLLEAEVPVVGLWIQDWVGQRRTSFGKQLWWNWELDRDHYNDWDDFLGMLEEEEIRLLGYVNPFLVDTSDKRNVSRDLYSEAQAKGFLVKNADGEPKDFQITSFSAALIDLTIPEAREWLKGIIKEELVENGFSGWMADFGEALPLDAEMASGELGDTFHHRYPEEWAKLNREVLEEVGLLDEGMFFVRAAYSESPRYASAFWLGDQLVTWDEHDGIKTAVTGLLSSGLSGFSLNHSDIGGYTSITDFPLNYVRSEELLLRWIELNAFTALFRSHEGNRPDENIQLYSNERIIGHVKEFGDIFAALAPYRQELMEEAATTGAPVVRPMFFHYFDDPETYKINYEQFMLGPYMIVAPVLDEGVEEVSVYLPEGEWIHHWSGETISVDSMGEYVEVYAPIGEPGVFYRQGAEVARVMERD